MAFAAGAARAFEGTAGGWYWQNPLVQGNSLNDVSVTSSRAVAVGDAGVVYTSTDGGVKWTRRSSGMRRRLLSVDFVDASRGWAVGDAGVIKTTDGGLTWTAKDTPGVGSYHFTSVSFVDASHGWACGSYAVPGAGTASRILRTVDGGDHWTIAEEWNSSRDSKEEVQFLLQVDFVSATTGWATGWGCWGDVADAGAWGYVVLKTSDGGDTWSITRFGDGRAAITAMDFTSGTSGWLATATLAGYHPAMIWKTSDGGATWAARAAKDGATITDLAASPAGECYASGQTQALSDWSGFVLHSVNDGASWSQEHSQDSEKPEAVGFASGRAVAVGAGALFLSRNSATGTWTQFAPGIRKNLTNVQFANAKLGWAVGWKSTILRTTDGGRKWVATSVPSGISLEGIDMVTTKIGWAVGCSGPHVPYADLSAGYGAVVLRTKDGGRHWKYQVDRTTKPGLAAVDFTDTRHGVAVGTSGVTARTTNGGKKWWFKTIGSATLRDVRFTSAGSGVAVGGDTGTRSSNGSIWKTDNGGVTWAQATTDPAPIAPLRAISVQRGESDEVTGLTVVGDRSQIYLSGGDVGAWTYADMTPGVVVQDPPFYHYMDIGLCEVPGSALVSANDVDGWALGEDGAIWTQSITETAQSPWHLPPTISSFAPASGAPGTTVAVYGSGFKPVKPGDTGAIGWIDVTDGGFGYTIAPTVTVESPELGSRATATATIDANGTVTSIALVDGGFGYSAGRLYRVDISPPPATGTQATAVAVPLMVPTVTFAGSAPAVPSAVSDTQLTVVVPVGAASGKLTVSTWCGTATSIARFWVPGTTPAVQTHLLPHSGGSGQDNQLNGLAVVDWLNAWAVGDRGTILSFDRLPPETTVSPSTGWVNTPQITLSATDGKSGVAWIRWIVDPAGIEGDVHPPIGDWDTWAWQYGSKATFAAIAVGDAPGTKHVIYYQSLDNVGNVELDPFWLKRGDRTDETADMEVPKHMWVTLDTLGPQTYAPWPVSVVRGKKPAFAFWVNDNLSDKAKVSIVIRNRSGKTVKTLSLGWLATWQEFSSPMSSWKCTLAKGAYTFSVRAQDQAGNAEAIRGGNTFTVR